MKLLICTIILFGYCSALNVTKTVKLNNGAECPVIGLGTGGHRAGGLPDPKIVPQMVFDAVEAGYRHIDTASSYGDEKAIGEALNQLITNGKIKRSDIFITTKIFGRHASEIGMERNKQKAIEAVELALKNLNTSYVDLMLIHQPSNETSTDTEVWKGLEEALDKGWVKSIGVSNFNVEQLTALLKTVKVIPAMNQIESSPQKNQRQLIDFCEKKSIRVTAYSPLGAGTLTTNTTIVEIGKKHSKSAAQVMIRWQIQRGVIAIPKSTKKERIIENINVFDFSLTDDEMKRLENF